MNDMTTPADVRVVRTGHTADGVGHVVSDAEVGPRAGLAADGWQAYLLWGVDAMPQLPDDGDHSFSAPTPPLGAARFVQLVVYPAGTEQGAGDAEALAGVQRPEGDTEGMHFTSTVDLVVVLEGEVTLKLDSEETVLRQGDFLVQNGTRHAWINRGQVPARLGVVVLGAEHAGF
jgi:mannose-6-phosphate isomerase-like protein (cupin superfamily)